MAHYEVLIAWLTGTTLGVLIANVPAVWIEEVLAYRINMNAIRWVAAASFIGLGIWTLACGGARLC